MMIIMRRLRRRKRRKRRRKRRYKVLEGRVATTIGIITT